MYLFKWTHALETGIPLVDRQHHELIEHANRFLIRCKCGKDKLAAADCLSFLQQYILYHFQTEEAFQIDCHYPRYKEHNAIHLSIATQVKFLSVKMAAADYSPALIDAFYTFLTDFISAHIYEEDLHFAAFYRHFLSTQKTLPRPPCGADGTSPAGG